MRKLGLLLITLFISTLAYSQVSIAKVLKLVEITTATRDGLSIAANEFPVIYNGTTNRFERYNGATWEEWGGGGAAASDITFVPYSTIASTNVQDAIQEVLDEAASGVNFGDINTSAKIAAIVGDETGTGNLVFNTSPSLVTPALGTPSALVLTNATGLPELQVTQHETALTITESQISDLTHTGADNLGVDADRGDFTVATGNATIDTGVVTTGKILDGTIKEEDLDAANTPTDEYVLTWEATGSTLIWEDRGTSAIGGSITDNQIAVGSGVNTIEGSSALEWDGTTMKFTPNVSPTTGAEGKLYANSTSNRLKYHTGAAYLDMLVAGDANSWSDPVDSDILSDGDQTRALGSVGNRFTSLFAQAVNVNANVTASGFVFADRYNFDLESADPVVNQNEGQIIWRDDLKKHRVYKNAAWADLARGKGDDITVDGATSGTATITAPAVAGTPTITLPTSSLDMDDLVSDVASNTAKTTNATHTGDVIGATALTITDGAILESHLKSVNAPTDEYVLTYESTTGDFEWEQDAGGGDIYKHPFSPVSVDSIYVGTVAQIAAAGLGTDVLAFPTDASNNLEDIADVTETSITTGDKLEWSGTAWVNVAKEVKVLTFHLSDFTTEQTGSTSVATYIWRAPYAMTLTDIRGNVTTAGTTASITMDVHDGATTIMTTNKVVIEATETTSEDATTQPTLTDTAIADNAVLNFFIDVDDTGGTGRGYTIQLYYTK